MDRPLRHSCSSPECTATGLPRRGNRRGPPPSYCGIPEVQTRARITDGKDGLRGSVVSHPCHTVQSTVFANGVAERWVGSVRRDLLDHVIPLNWRHLRRLLTEYIRYYHEDRTHLGLNKDTPNHRVVASAARNGSKIISTQRLGGLHYRYTVAA